MFKVYVNSEFIDRETGKEYKTGDVIQLSEIRIKEIQAVSKDLISVLGKVEETATKKKEA